MMDSLPPQAQDREPLPKVKVCRICGEECHNLSKQKLFCCLDLPAQAITKPLREWLCLLCAERRLIL